MDAKSNQNINQDNNFENKIIFNRLDNILFYIIIVIDKIIILPNSFNLKRTKTLSIQEDFSKNKFLCLRNHFIKIKNDLVIALIKIGKKK